VSELSTALVFWPGAVVMLLAAVFMFRTASMTRAGLLLLVALAVEGLLFLALASQFLGVLQLLMMSAEMIVMVFFMVMFMPDPGGLMGMDMTHQKRTAAGFALVVGIALAVLAVLTDWPARTLPADAPDVRAIGFEVMGRSMFTFLFAGVTILFSMVGAVMLAERAGRFDRAEPGA
jgi:NADH-quinone oxidoreductase subunit J